MNLFALGPVAMYPHTLQVSGKQLPYFRTPEFSEVMLESERLLKKVLYAPKDAKTVFLTASGTAAMEATVMNCFTEKDRLLIIDGGIFGHRFTEICKIHAVPYDAVTLRFGERMTPEHLAPYDGGRYTALAVNIHETSTGQLYDVHMLSDFCRRNGMYLVVDAISSFLADEYRMEEFGIDATILSSQKGLAISPGMSLVVLSSRLYEEKVLRNRPKTLYFNFVDHVVNQKRGQTPFTPAVGVALELNDMLRHLEAEGVENRLRHVQQVVEDFRQRLRETELSLPDYPISYAASPLLFPRENAWAVYETLKKEYDTVLTPGGGDLKNKLLRVGHLGNHTAEENPPLIRALREVLRKV